MKKLLTAVTAAAVLMGCGANTDSPESEEKSIREIQEKEGIPVTAAPVQQGTIRRTMELGGTAQGIHQTYLSNAAGGTLRRINVSVGDTVRKGEVVATMKFDQGSPIAVAQSAYDYAQKSYMRIKKLHEQGAVSQSDVEAAKAQYENAKHNLGKARVAQYVKAPFTGKVLRIMENEGTKISTKTPLMQLADMSDAQINLEANESSVDRFARGQKCYVTVNADTVWGDVTEIALSASAMTHGFKIETVFPDNTLLKPGMYKLVQIIIEEREDALQLPVDVIRTDRNGTAYVYTVQGNTVAKTPVETGITDGINYEITGGISPGTSVVMTGISRISDGSTVNVVNR
ncbi:MAG: efflux RND transporter periplasmic adaptor subunit [Fibrobacterota bacterium]